MRKGVNFQIDYILNFIKRNYKVILRTLFQGDYDIDPLEGYDIERFHKYIFIYSNAYFKCLI
jgi:hypothetical protein